MTAQKFSEECCALPYSTTAELISGTFVRHKCADMYYHNTHTVVQVREREEPPFFCSRGLFSVEEEKDIWAEEREEEEGESDTDECILLYRTVYCRADEMGTIWNEGNGTRNKSGKERGSRSELRTARKYLSSIYNNNTVNAFKNNNKDKTSSLFRL